MNIKQLGFLMRIEVLRREVPLTYAFRQKLEKCSPRQFRYLDFTAQFTTDIRYVKGVENEVADTLSRIETVKNSVDRYPKAREEQYECGPSNAC